MTARPITLARHVSRMAESASLTALTDRELLDRFTTGKDRAAFEILVRRHGQLVVSACRQVLADSADIDDAFQATFLTLLLQADSIRKRDSIGSWLFGTAHRIAVQARASTRRRKQCEAKAARIAADDRPALDLSWREAVGLLHEELDRLPDRHRLPLLLCYLQGKSRDEAAEQLGWTTGSVKGRLERGREELRKRLTRRGITLGATLLGALGNSSAAGALPPRLVQATLKAAICGPVPAAVAALTGGVSAVLGSKIKLTAALVLCLGLCAGIAGHRMSASLGASPPTPASGASNGPGNATHRGVHTPRSPREPGRPDKLSIHGRVLAPDGRPVKGAKLFIRANDKAKQRATTGGDGRFRLTVKPAEIKAGATLIATADGFGPDWIDLKANTKGEPGASAPGGKELTLRLVKDDVPITGRVLDLEGKPVAGVTVRILNLGKTVEEDLTEWIAARKKNRYGGALQYLSPPALPGPSTVKTGKDGRFRLSGFGRERVVSLKVVGANIEHSRFWVMTRAKRIPGLRIGRYGTYSASFDHLAGPSKPIVGTVRDKKTGQPIAGVFVRDGTGMGRATTDKNGRYRLAGVPKRKEYAVSVGGGPGVPYFDVSKHDIADTRGLGPITVDFELERGVEITGRVTDKHTGKPVRCEVRYSYRRDNPHLKDYPSLTGARVLVSDWGETDADGKFTTLAIPGPGVLVVCTDRDKAIRFMTLDKKKELRKRKVRIFPGDPVHAVLSINVSEKDPKTLRYNITLDPGRSRAGKIVGPDGKPLAGTRVAGLATGLSPHRLETATFTVRGLSDRPRVLVFFDREKKLGKVQEVRGDKETPITVRLEQLGTVTGRLVDAEGRPLAGRHVGVFLDLSGKEYDNLPLDYYFQQLPIPDAWHEFTSRRAVTDKDGRFRLEGLLPGTSYLLAASAEEFKERKPLTHQRKGVSVEPGQVKDLGDIKSNPFPKR